MEDKDVDSDSVSATSDEGSDSGDDQQSSDADPASPTVFLSQDPQSPDSGSDSDPETVDPESGHHGLADVMSRILSRKPPAGSSVILSKGKTDRELTKRAKRKHEDVEVVQADGKVTKTSKVQQEESSDDEKDRNARYKKQLAERKLWEGMARVKPSVLQREKERRLQKIATKGVVQLFNAVKTQQKVLESKLKEVGSSQHRRDTVLKTMTKGSFLDVLKGSAVGEEGTPTTQPKAEPTVKEEKLSWSILREDFMLGAEMKDWDKAGEGGDESGDEDGDWEDSDGDT